MCLLLIGNKVHPDYPFILAANRDEFYSRPAEPAKFWSGSPGLLAGKDLKEGGTWLGVTKSGRIAAVTNYRDLSNLKEAAPSRGHLLLKFLQSEISTEEFNSYLIKNSGNYNGFNLIFGSLNEIYYFSSQTNEGKKLNEGIFGLSNHLLDSPWYKVEIAKNKFEQIIDNSTSIEKDILSLLTDTSLSPDELLPETGLTYELEKLVSSIFIKTETYGTRSSTIIMMHKNGTVTFKERTFLPTGLFEDADYKFEMNN
jgi:uncharacterized protein with NRDE domain